MVKQAAARTIDLEPIDRLEEKVKLLVGLVTRLRLDQKKAADDYARLSAENEALRSRLEETEGSNADLAALRDERELIRSRVADMLEQLEAI
jgi:Tfp pilus assembly protein PilO